MSNHGKEDKIIDNNQNIHQPFLYENGFVKQQNNTKFNNMGTCYKLNPSLGCGYYWIYNHENLFSIVIHDFYFHEDYFFESPELEYYSVTYYESVAGEELNPYHRLNAGCIKSYWCSHSKYRAIFHKDIPIHSIGIEFMPQYCITF